MIYCFSSYDDLDARQLMDLYAEGNEENADYFYPDEPDRAKAVAAVEADFLNFLKEKFFTAPGRTYWVLEENGIYISALRLAELDGRLFYLEALETRPDFRRHGYAAKLLRGVVEALTPGGGFRICDCVRKKNAASIKTHEACGFAIVPGPGYDYLSQTSDEGDYGMELRFDGISRGHAGKK